MHLIKRIKIFVLLICCSTILSGCYFRDPLPAPNRRAEGVAVGAVSGAAIAALGSAATSAPLGAVIGGIAGGAVGDYLGRNDTIENELTRQHVRLIRVGDEMRIILFSDIFFYQHSQVLNPRYYPVLKLLSKYLAQFHKTSVKVAGYTDNQCTQKRDIALSTEQADNVAHFLWLQDIDTRMMYAVGYGQSYPLAKNNSAKNRALNRRVELTFRVLHDYL